AGMAREDAYAVVQDHAIRSWRTGGDFLKLLSKDRAVTAHLKPAALAKLFNIGYHTKHVDTIFRRVFGK
ncbi:MAG: adenylosuccinate lyase, partial [Rhodospirillaceae bacterium]|nr:adenylosuccinate lyase [Rhodospirillaceae bacterium]